MHFDHGFPFTLLLPDSAPPHPPTSYPLLFFKEPMEYSWCGPYTWGCAAFYWSMGNPPGDFTLKQNWFPLFRQLSIANSSSARSGISRAPLSSLGFYLSWAQSVLVYAVSTAMNSYVSCPLNLKQGFLVAVHHLWLSAFCFSFATMISQSGGGVWYRCPV